MLVAAIVVTGAFAAGISVLSHRGEQASGRATDLDAKAHEMLRLVVTDSGRTTTGATAWDANPDAIERFGLASGRGRNFVSGEKIEGLRHGLREAYPSNGHPDYPEVRGALGLGGHDFHLRSFPLVYAVDDERFNKFRGMNAAYVGEFVSTTTPDPQVTVTTTLDQDAGRIVVTFRVACEAPFLGSPFPDVLVLTTKLKTGTGAGHGTIVQNHYSPVIDCSGADAVDVPVRYENVDLKSYADAWKLTFDLKSVFANRMLADNEAVTLALADGSEEFVLSAEPDAANFWSTGAGAAAPVVILDKLTKAGTRHETAVVVDVTVTPPAGAPVTFEDVRIPPTASHRLTLDGLAATAALGTFVASVATANGTGVAAAEGRFTFTTSEYALPAMESSPRALVEITILDELVAAFDGDRYRDDAGGTGLGDVFRDVVDDTRKTLADVPHGERVLWDGRDGAADTGDEYDIVVIGGGVKSSALAGDMAGSLREWVEEEGKTLLVLGVDENNAQWLRAEFGIQLVTASGGIGAPDPTHPMLTSPEPLNYRSYDAGGRRYEMTGTVYEGFSHVLVGRYDASESEDLLAVSNPGVYGKGTVILASYIPQTMTPDAAERLKFMNNMLTQSLHQIVLDFGPKIPAGVPVGSASRLAVAPHPLDSTLFMELKLVLYVWE